MKKIISSLALAVISMTSQIAYAGAYWGVGISDYELEVSDNGVVISADTMPIEGVLGINTSPNIGWEGRFGLALNDKKVMVSGEDTGAKNTLDYYLSAYFKPQINFNSFNLYGLLGYSSVANTVRGGPVSTEESTDNGFSYGIGAALEISSHSSINLEWKNLCDTDDGDIEGFTVGYRYTF